MCLSRAVHKAMILPIQPIMLQAQTSSKLLAPRDFDAAKPCTSACAMMPTPLDFMFDDMQLPMHMRRAIKPRMLRDALAIVDPLPFDRDALLEVGPTYKLQGQ